MYNIYYVYYYFIITYARSAFRVTKKITRLYLQFNIFSVVDEKISDYRWSRNTRLAVTLLAVISYGYSDAPFSAHGEN